MARETDLDKLRHSTAHVMAEAVLELFPDAQIAIGPSIENGFYYDFELPRALTQEDLDVITENMKAIMKEGKPFVRKEVSRDEARAFFADQKYKLELLDAIPEGEVVTMYNQGKFTDLCRGPHVELTKDLVPEGFKLLNKRLTVQQHSAGKAFYVGGGGYVTALKQLVKHALGRGGSVSGDLSHVNAS